MSDIMNQRTATLIGFGAIALWATLATLTTFSGQVPALLLNGLTFSVGGLAGLLIVLRRPGGLSLFRQPKAAWALGVGGLCGYHALYFAALRLAPPAEAGLVNYLWPLLIVLFSAFLPGEKLRLHHVLGALLGLGGVVLVVAGQSGAALSLAHIKGYGLAFAAAFVWAGYSVLSRKFAAVPTEAVAGFCLATAALSFLGHALFENTQWPSGSGEWLAVVALGLGPVGAAFFLWDIGMKRGDIRILGAASYLAPLFSTLILVMFGRATMSGSLAAACLLITAGAIMASKDMLLSRN